MDFLRSLGSESDLLPGVFKEHRERNTEYLMELTADNLLLHFRREAGLTSSVAKLENCHWGWDGPLSDLRGQATGHWLSAAARVIRATKNADLKRKADFIVSEIGRCQREHGNGWCFSIPEKNLYWLKRGKHTWAPQYVCHKIMLGLFEMARIAGNAEAWEILLGAADWFDRFTADITPGLMDDMMDWEETGGMMELWADLYDVTREEKHLRLMRLYERRRLFEPLLRGEDMLTNMHANTTIPEIHGAARAYEVTGEERYRRIVERYWELAVTERGMYATGGQTCGEIWTPMGMQAARLGSMNQEHCVVYNMIRLADYLFRWTGDMRYADYIERNLWNGLLAQAHWQEEKNRIIDCDIPEREWKRGLVAYYLPLAAGSVKRWASRTESFWCCVDTMMQANAIFQDFSFYAKDGELTVAQFHGVRAETKWAGVAVQLSVDVLRQTGESVRYHPIQREIQKRPDNWTVEIRIKAEKAINGTVRVRIPWWTTEPTVILNGGACAWKREASSIRVEGVWKDDVLRIVFPKRLTVHPLADEPGTVAFLDGPVTLAGICGEERTLWGDIENPETILKPAEERRWQEWLPDWTTRNQPVNFRFKPLWAIGDERYTVYFPVRRGPGNPGEGC